MNNLIPQSFTRKWANDLGVPVISLDYSKAPEAVFPTPIDECEVQYKFIVDQLHSYLNVRPKNIILCADSAGAVISSGLLIRLMKQSYHTLPSGMLYIYPSTTLDGKYTHSYLKGVKESLISVSMLNSCKNAYISFEQKGELEANPIYLDRKTVNASENPLFHIWKERWPKTIFMVGKRDPLLDDSLKLF